MDTPFNHGSGLKPEVESNRFPNCCIFMEIKTGYCQPTGVTFNNFV